MLPWPQSNSSDVPAAPTVRPAWGPPQSPESGAPGWAAPASVAALCAHEVTLTSSAASMNRRDAFIGSRSLIGTLHREHNGKPLSPATGGNLLFAPGVSGQELDHGLTNAVEICSELLQHLSGDAFTLADQPEQDVLGTDVVVSELERLAERQLQDLLGARGERDVTGGCGLPLADDLFDLLADGLQRDVQGFECLRSDALALVDQAEEDVLGADVVVVEHPRFFLRENHDAPGAIRESLEHLTRPPGRGPLPLRRSGIAGPRPPPEVHRAPRSRPQRPYEPSIPVPLRTLGTTIRR